MDEEQEKRFWKFVMGDDLDFYEEYTIHLTDEEQEKFLMKIQILCVIIQSAVIKCIC